MGGVGGVLHDAVGFAGASCKENVQDGWERGEITSELCCIQSQTIPNFPMTAILTFGVKSYIF